MTGTRSRRGEPVSYSPCFLAFTFILYHSSRARKKSLLLLNSPCLLLTSSFLLIFPHGSYLGITKRNGTIAQRKGFAYAYCIPNSSHRIRVRNASMSRREKIASHHCKSCIVRYQPKKQALAKSENGRSVDQYWSVVFKMVL